MGIPAAGARRRRPVVRHGRVPARRGAAARVEALRREIRRHDHLYYVLDAPEISDEAYDCLSEELRALESRHPELITPDSPTQRVGGEPLPQFATVLHSAPLLSLESTRDISAVRRFVQRMGSRTGSAQLLLQPKFDGASVELVYERGLLTRAITRGNGREGEDVTANVRTVPSIPLVLQVAHRAAPRKLAVRGEVLMDRDAFRALNKSLLETGDVPMANPRNAAAGALRQLDPRITARRRLRFIGYEILDISGASFDADIDALAALRDWSVPTPDHTQVVADVDAVIAYHADLERRRESLSYEIDGIVVKANVLERRTALGATAHHPRWAIAFKFAPRTEVTRVEDIVLQVGRTGVLTPVALLRPVDVSGVTVSRATLHNRADLEARDIRVGDRVRVHRAGDVIPEIVEYLSEPRHRRHARFRMPSRCPACHARIEARGPLSVCPNTLSCPAQLARTLVHLASEDGFDIAGLGAETASALVREGIVKTPADLFRLSTRDIRGLSGFAERSSRKLADAIQAARHIPLHRFLFAIGIPDVGPTTAREIATHFGTLQRVRRASKVEFAAAPGLGINTSSAIHAALHQPRMRSLVDALLDNGVVVESQERGATGSLAGKCFVFTGALAHLTRREASALVEARGGAVQPHVTAATDYVIVGTKPGEKLGEASRRGVPTLTERAFLALVR